jgi:hypothetical protein
MRNGSPLSSIGSSAGMAFTRGIPWLARLLLQWIPAERAVPEYKRQLAAIGLTAQMFAGAGLGFAAQGFLALVIIHYAIPLLGLDLLDMARAVATFDLPARVGQLFAGFLYQVFGLLIPSLDDHDR